MYSHISHPRAPLLRYVLHIVSCGIPYSQRICVLRLFLYTQRIYILRLSLYNEDVDKKVYNERVSIMYQPRPFSLRNSSFSFIPVHFHLCSLLFNLTGCGTALQPTGSIQSLPKVTPYTAITSDRSLPCSLYHCPELVIVLYSPSDEYSRLLLSIPYCVRQISRDKPNARTFICTKLIWIVSRKWLCG